MNIKEKLKKKKVPIWIPLVLLSVVSLTTVLALVAIVTRPMTLHINIVGYPQSNGGGLQLYPTASCTPGTEIDELTIGKLVQGYPNETTTHFWIKNVDDVTVQWYWDVVGGEATGYNFACHIADIGVDVALHLPIDGAPNRIYRYNIIPSDGNGGLAGFEWYSTTWTSGNVQEVYFTFYAAQDATEGQHDITINFHVSYDPYAQP